MSWMNTITRNATRTRPTTVPRLYEMTPSMPDMRPMIGENAPRRFVKENVVIPAQAGIQRRESHWIPAWPFLETRLRSFSRGWHRSLLQPVLRMSYCDSRVPAPTMIGEVANSRATRQIRRQLREAEG